MDKFGGGGVPCTKCEKNVYPAETISFEKKPYHVDCFRCKECDKKTDPGNTAAFENEIYCKHCFNKNGYAQKQRNVKWTPKEGGGGAVASKFGGGGTKCVVCMKTCYPAEAQSFEKQIYHADCMSCSTCEKKITGASAAGFEGKLYCHKCFSSGGFAQKQRNVKWTPKEGSGNAMASKFGGGGTKCFLCDKTVYAAETISFDKKPFHAECFKCTTCSKVTQPSNAAMWEDKLYCSKCFKENGYAKQQASTSKSSGDAPKAYSAKFSKFGGGGNKCKICEKTVYPAETIMFEKDAYHQNCFTCKNCDKKLNAAGAQYTKEDHVVTGVYCVKCFGELGLNRA